MSSKIKLKDLIKEGWVSRGGVVSIGKGFVSEDTFSTDESNEFDSSAFLESVRGYAQHGKNIYRQGNLKEVATALSTLAEQAATHTLKETGDDFDKITVGRNMKELKGYSDQFNKFAKEANTLQQRIESLYEDMGTILNRYYQIDELQEEK